MMCASTHIRMYVRTYSHTCILDIFFSPDQFGPDAVQTLAPLVVNVLESLDNALGDNDNNERELGELTEKYELLAEQFEKEKQRRKDAEEV